MDPLLKKVIAVLASVFVLSIAYYGNYLPLRKSQAFISTMQNLRSASSLGDFEKMVSVPLDIPSPVGQEELVRNMSNIILNLVQQNSNPQTIAEVIDYLQSYYQPIVDSGRGMSFEQNLYILGTLNEVAFVKTKQQKFFDAAKNYYSEGHKLGPKRPQFLYGMFDIYRIEGNVEGAKAIGAQILSQWPDDERTKQAFAEFLSQVAAAQAAAPHTSKK